MSNVLKTLLNNNKKFTQICKQAFSKVDVDNSGQIDKRELEELFLHLASDIGMKITNDELNDIMDLMDADKSGQIDFDEFKSIVRECFEYMLEEDY
jgi:Ca2+-binding EF-hand superfamily protein